MQRGADKLRARCFMKQHASRDARVPGSLAAQPRPASVAPSAGRDRAARVDPWPSGPDATRALGRTPQRPECRALGCATYMGAPLTDRRFLLSCYKLVNDTLTCTILATSHPRERSRAHALHTRRPHGTWPNENCALTKADPHKPKGAASASKSERPDVAPPAAPAQRVIARLEDLKQLSASGGGS